MIGGEDKYAEQPALTWLCGDGEAHAGLGWAHLHGSELAPDAPDSGRETYADVVLVARLRKALSRLKPDAPAAALEDAVKAVVATQSPQLIEDHRRFHELLLSGAKVTYSAEGQERTALVKLVD